MRVTYCVMAYDVLAGTVATTARGSHATRAFRSQLLFTVHTSVMLCQRWVAV